VSKILWDGIRWLIIYRERERENSCKASFHSSCENLVTGYILLYFSLLYASLGGCSRINTEMLHFIPFRLKKSMKGYVQDSSVSTQALFGRRNLWRQSPTEAKKHCLFQTGVVIGGQ
jgi:hypothetical protein